jgi:hypothetical protein
VLVITAKMFLRLCVQDWMFEAGRSCVFYTLGKWKGFYEESVNSL